MQKEHYWSLVLEPGWTQAAVWTIEDKATKVITVAPGSAWEEGADLVNAVDSSLSAAIADLPDDISEPSKTVFGVSPSWVSEGQIKKEHLDKIKEICSKLSLIPTGFVVLTEAIAHFIKSEEGSPLTGIVVGVGATSLDVTLFKLGNLVGTITVGRSVSVVEDVTEALVRFNMTEPLPSRFLIYNGKLAELEDVKQELIKADWTHGTKESVSFLHTPKVEIIDPEEKIVAVSLAGASEMGEVSRVHFKKKEEDIENQNIGHEHKNISPAMESAVPQDVGFSVGEDILLKKESGEETENTSPAPSDGHKLLTLPHIPFLMFLSRIKNMFNKIPIPFLRRRQQNPFAGGEGQGKRPFVFAGVFLLVLLIGGFFFWWFYPKADVTIYVSPKQLERRETITIDPSSSSSDFSAKSIKGEVKKITVSGDKTTAATGTKVIGEKAKGTVSIRNGTGVSIKVNSGTELIGPNDLKFTVDETASVSAALSPSSPGTTTLPATALKIGSEYNLAKNETFKVGNYPKNEVDALVENDFTGGSSREITAVSAEDLKNLESELSDELLEQARQQLQDGLSSEEIFLSESAISTVVKKTFSNKVGDEASTIKLSMEVEVSGVVSKSSDFEQLGMEILQGQVAEGFVLRGDQITTSFSTPSEEDGKWTFDVNFSANLLPEVKPDEIAQKISGKYKTSAQDYLSTIPGFARAEIKLRPSLPGRLGTLPHVSKNITIEVSAED